MGEKRTRDRVHKRRMKQLYQQTRHRNPAPVYEKTIKTKQPRLVRVYRGKAAPYLKRICNRRIRHFSGELHNKGNQCHKLLDFRYELD